MAKRLPLDGVPPGVKWTRWCAAYLTLVASIVLIMPRAETALAHDSHGWVWVGDQRIYNYDYRSTSATLANSDWPVHLVFWNSGSVNRVKNMAQDVFAYNCNVLNFCDQQIRYDPTHRTQPPSPETGWKWDTDGGRKELRCGYSGGDNYWAMHYRAYDNQAVNLWNPYWGYWVPLTTHYDYDDPDSLPFSPCDNKAHGYDEEAEWNTYYTYLYACSALSGIQNWEHWHNRSQNPDGTTKIRYIGGVPHYGTGTGQISIIHMPVPYPTDPCEGT